MFKRGDRVFHHKSGTLAALLASFALVATACQAGTDDSPESADNGGKATETVAGDDGSDSEPEPEPEPEPTPQATLAITPRAGTTEVRPDNPVTVKAELGTLSEVVVSRVSEDDADVQNAADVTADAEGQDQVGGKLSNDETTWVSRTGLMPDTTYRVDAVAVDANGLETTRTLTFTTRGYDVVLGTEIYPDGTTVGVGHPIVVNFTTDVADQAKPKVERALKVQTSKPTDGGAWHWLTDDTIHYRPRSYWPANTDVTIRLNLQGVSGGEGVWGIKNKVKRFSVGRSVVSKVDLNAHTQKVYINGDLARTIPITAGSPGWETRSGVKVVLEKRTDITLRSESIGIEDKDSPDYYNMFAPYALRVTWSGEFHHSADWSTWAHGNSNVSHGCVGMSIENSRWLWEQSLVGDVVEVVGSDKPMDISGNGYGDWNLSWKDWVAGSALR